jgi:hypothetical protein
MPTTAARPSKGLGVLYCARAAAASLGSSDAVAGHRLPTTGACMPLLDGS